MGIFDFERLFDLNQCSRRPGSPYLGRKRPEGRDKRRGRCAEGEWGVQETGNKPVIFENI